MKRITDYKSLAKRFREIGVEQDEYKKSYITFSNFLLQMKNTNINMAYIPVEYAPDVEKYYDEIKEVVSDYAATLGAHLEKYPGYMIEGLEDVIKVLTPAIDAAERLSRGESTDRLRDIMAVKKLLNTTANFANYYSELCGEIVDDINKFMNEEMLTLQTDMNVLVSELEKTSKTYKNSKRALKDQIAKLQDMAKSDTNAAFALMVGAGVFISLGVIVVGMVATGGSALPALLALAAIGTPALIAGTAVGVLFSEAHSVQEQIDSIMKQMDLYDRAIAQVDIYADGYNNMLSQFEDVKKALGIMKEEWQVLAEELTELSSKVDEGSDSLENEEWAELRNILSEIQKELNVLGAEIQKVNIADTNVSLADLNAEMSEEELKAACEKAEQKPLLKYLRMAS